MKFIEFLVKYIFWLALFLAVIYIVPKFLGMQWFYILLGLSVVYYSIKSLLKK